MKIVAVRKRLDERVAIELADELNHYELAEPGQPSRTVNATVEQRPEGWAVLVPEEMADEACEMLADWELDAALGMTPAEWAAYEGDE